MFINSGVKELTTHNVYFTGCSQDNGERSCEN